SSATYQGAKQIPGFWGSLSIVVSGGGSAAARLGWKPRSPAVPAKVNPLRNSRRLRHLAYWILMGTSLPDAVQCNPRMPARFSGSFAQYQRSQGAMTDVICLTRLPVNHPTPHAVRTWCSVRAGRCLKNPPDTVGEPSFLVLNSLI